MPISITRVYTRTGDGGETSLVGGKRVAKDSPRIVAYGTLDELNAIVGLARTFNAERLNEGEHHRWLDEVLRQIQNELPPLKSFTLPGGGRVNAFLHQARTVCRRAERELLAASRTEAIGEWPLRYVNRLSDLFFVLSRWVARHLGETEYLWERGLASHARRSKKR